MNKTSLVDEVRNYLRDAIITLKYRPGEQLNETAILSKLDISRSPLREAFRLLEGEGLVTWKSRRGVFVNEITSDDVKELFPIRASLEALATELAAPRLTDKDISQLGTIVKKMEDAVNDGNIRASIKLNFEFHKQIVKAAGNKRLEQIIKTLGRQSMWLTFAAIYHDKEENFAIGSHKEIYLALKDRNGEKAAALIKEHIGHGGLKVSEFFSGQ